MIVMCSRVSSEALMVVEEFVTVTCAEAPPVPPTWTTRWTCPEVPPIVRSSVWMVVPDPAVTATLSANPHLPGCGEALRSWQRAPRQRGRIPTSPGKGAGIRGCVAAVFVAHAGETYKR